MKQIHWAIVTILLALFAFALWFTSCATVTTPEDKIIQNSKLIEVSFRAVTRESLSIVKLNQPDRVGDIKQYWEMVAIQFANASTHPDMTASAVAQMVAVLFNAFNDELKFLPENQARLVASLLKDTGEVMSSYLMKVEVPAEIQLYLAVASKGINDGILQAQELP